MKQLTCEMCEGTDLIKQDGVFVCQTCGCKYSVEEAKVLMNGQGCSELSEKGQSNGKLNNLISNCVLAYNDGRYNKVIELSDQIMNEEPQNTTAIIYNGLAVFQQYNKNPDDIHQSESLIMRGLKIISNSPDNYDELFYICYSELVKSYNKISTDFLQIFQSNSETCAAFLREVANKSRQAGFDLLIGGTTDVLRVNADNEIKSLQQKAAHYEAIYKNAQQMALDLAAVFDKIIIEYSRILKNRKYFAVDTYDKIVNVNYNFWGGSKHNNEVIVEHFNDIENNAKKMKKEYEDAVLKAEKKKRFDEYWAAHQEERNQLDAKKNSLLQQIDGLKSQISEIEQEIKPELDKLYAERDKAVPAREEYDDISNQKNNINAKMDTLGLFHMKEKKELKLQIDELRTRADKVWKEIEPQEKERNRIVNEKINKLKEQGNEQRTKLAELNSQLEEVEKELKKDR